MSVNGIGEKVKNKLERKMAQVAERLAQLQDDSELRATQAELSTDLEALEHEIAVLMTSEGVRPGARDFPHSLGHGHAG